MSVHPGTDDAVTDLLVRTGRLFTRCAASVDLRRAILSNLCPAGFDELIGKTIATATIDRRRHRAHAGQTSGGSVQRSQALGRSLAISGQIS